MWCGPCTPPAAAFTTTRPISAATTRRGPGILELTSSDGGSAILGVFRLSDPDEAQTTVLFRGLDISKRYRLTMDNSGASAVISGYKLMNKGVTVNLPGALTSELLIAVEED